MTLFEEFKNISLETIDQYIEFRKEENVTLDFKILNNAKLTSKDDKKNLAKALSGFANSAGGIIIWGVDARKNENGIDCAVGKNEIYPLSLLVSRLNELTGDAVSPIIGKVFHNKIEIANDKGFATTYVPECFTGPHMAKLGEDRYYKRSGDSFYRMEHFDIADMFGRRKRPVLQLKTRISGNQKCPKIIIGIENTGKGSAKAPFLAFKTSPSPWVRDLYGLDGNHNDGMKRINHTGSDLLYRYGESADFVIHPGTTHEVTKIWLGKFQPELEEVSSKDLTIEYAIAAEGYQLERKKLVLKFDEIF